MHINIFIAHHDPQKARISINISEKAISHTVPISHFPGPQKLRDALVHLCKKIEAIGIHAIVCAQGNIREKTIQHPRDTIQNIDTWINGKNSIAFPETLPEEQQYLLFDTLALIVWQQIKPMKEYGEGRISCTICGSLQGGIPSGVTGGVKQLGDFSSPRTLYTYQSPNQCLNPRCYSHVLGELIDETYERPEQIANTNPHAFDYVL